MNMIPSRLRLHGLRAGLPAILLMLLVTAPLQAQEGAYRISQRATLSQKLGNTLVSLDYSRPLARDRDDVFGKVVHWGELWTPGANEATVLEVSHDVKLNGHVVKPGRWSMWIIPSQVGPWELVLEARDSLFHTQRPELTDDQVRFVIDARQDAPHVEALTWSFPRVAQDGATLLLNWGTLEVPLEVEVESIEPATKVTAEDAAIYVGEWRVEFEPMDNGMTRPPTTLTVHYGDDGRLHATYPPRTMGPPPDTAAAAAAEAQMTPQERERAEARRTLAAYASGEFRYVLVPRAPGVFLMGWVEDDVLLDAGYVYHEFEVENGRAVSLALRNDKDVVWGRATRAK
jgi:hypothetical protein